jgi:site-specific DNA recombinase
MKRAVGYPRVSTDKQAEAGYSLPEQREKIAAHCLAHGYPLVAMIEDDFTGRLIDRPGVRRINELADAGAFEVLVCVKLDRVARKNHLRAEYEERLEQRGICIEYVEQTFEATATGRLQKNIVGSFAEYEWEVIRERTMGGRLKKATAKQLMPCHCPVYGMRPITKAESLALPEFAGRSGEFLIVEEEAAIVREAFRLYAGGRGLRAVQTALNAAGYRARSGRPWSLASVRLVLTNEAYIGRLYFGKMACRQTDGLTAFGNPRKERKLRPKSEWIAIPCPKILEDESLFWTCQEILRENAERLRGRPTRRWLLHGSIVCGVCRTRTGKPRTCIGQSSRSGERQRGYYVCGSRHFPELGIYCGTSKNADAVETMAVDALHRAAEPHRLAEFARRDAEERAARAGDPQADMARLEVELATVDQEEERIANLVLAGLRPAVVEKKVEEIARRREELHRQIGAAQTRMAEVVSPGEAVRRAEVAAEQLRQALPEAERDPVRLQQLLHLFLQVAIFPDREPEITVRVPAVVE